MGHVSFLHHLSLSLSTVSSSLFLSKRNRRRNRRRNGDLSATMISPCRRHQSESLSVESSPLSLCGQRIQFSIGLLDDSASLSLSVSSSNLRLLVSLRRFHLPLDLLDDSAYLSLSTTAHVDQASLHLSLRPVAILDEIKPKVKAKFFSFYV